MWCSATCSRCRPTCATTTTWRRRRRRRTRRAACGHAASSCSTATPSPPPALANGGDGGARARHAAVFVPRRGRLGCAPRARQPAATVLAREAAAGRIRASARARRRARRRQVARRPRARPLDGRVLEAWRPRGQPAAAARAPLRASRAPPRHRRRRQRRRQFCTSLFSKHRPPLGRLPLRHEQIDGAAAFVLTSDGLWLPGAERWTLVSGAAPHSAVGVVVDGARARGVPRARRRVRRGAAEEQGAAAAEAGEALRRRVRREGE